MTRLLVLSAPACNMLWAVFHRYSGRFDGWYASIHDANGVLAAFEETFPQDEFLLIASRHQFRPQDGKWLRFGDSLEWMEPTKQSQQVHQPAIDRLSESVREMAMKLNQAWDKQDADRIRANGTKKRKS